MPSLYPGALDDFSNPAGSTTLKAGEHALLHGRINDAIEAVQAALGTLPQGGYDSLGLRLSAFGVDVRNYGAKGDGITDDTAAILDAHSANVSLWFPPGRTFIVSDNFPIEGPKRWFSSGGALGNAGAVIRCYGVTGFLFELDGTVQPHEVSIEGIKFDGRDAEGTYSSTWLGLLSNPTASTAGSYSNSLVISHCEVGYSIVPTAIGLDLKSMFFVGVTDTRVHHFDYGLAVDVGTINNVSTTLTFDRCYFNYCRQGVRVGPNVSDIHFRDCVFESSVVAASLYSCTALFTRCYFENLGYDVTSSGISTGLINKNFGNSFGAGILDTAIISAINLGYADAIFEACHFADRDAAHITAQPTAGWVFCMGRGSVNGSGGEARFTGCHVANYQSKEFFEVDAAASSDAFNRAWYSGSRREYMPYADIRKLTEGIVQVEMATVTRQLCEVRAGRLIIHAPSFTIPTTQIPTGGQYIVGDRIYYATPTAGGSIGAICTTAGSPGIWKTWAPVAA